MARWPRLYHDWVARLFMRGLYSGRFADLCPDWADFPGSSRAVMVFGGRGTAKVSGAAKQANLRRGEQGQEGKIAKGQVQSRVEEVKQFPAVERRRNPALLSEQREKGEVAIFQELGKALTSSLQLDQVLRTIMEKIDEFLRPDNWSLLLLDEEKQEL